MTYVWILIGVLIGSIVSNVIFYALSVSGTLKIDHSDSKKDVYRFEINNLENLNKKKRLIMKIDNHADLSQK